MKTCDNTSVGALIFDQQGRLLVFDRNTDPPGVAGPAGHVDDHGGPMDAVCTEVFEEVGLTVMSAELVTGGWHPNQCRRLPGPRGVGHQWQIFRVEVAGELNPSTRETRNARWADRVELQSLTHRTIDYACGWLAYEEFRARPGIEPVWLPTLVAVGLVDVAPEQMALFKELIARPLPQGDRA
ncbi:NUDIX domain-containing protein [Nonomuraea wenchangensis]|uniref:ADP-ribose pyrophosphatase YjhB, NUDIX family n=1 Tax=Nonomuraea wenchangensis TaxID=568860 RepID=A0A1I0LU36_9ACTN|nr:NUDIX hydrolase [Nonomuraea wenchangensis]SEU46724.1 ADP-ribose pyrophosphatase YjhB, NUDIX family [Nonomuraea wenchangensis]